ncbi:hypothetical protein C8Q72DRAFT_874513 [Fomitopsis betulina]|nr:hypothetical protein C8Q72DRAFT_874513 [Fomitopsis betulina]
MSANSTNSTSGGNETVTLPPSLDLSPHLSAQKYFFVCTLTVAAWDVLVLTPRTWRLMKSRGWPLLKLIYYFLRLYVPIEFTIVGIAFFDTTFSLERCSKFYLFEPICTAILLAITSFVHVYRIHAIYDKDRSILYGMGSLFALQVVVTAICCGFYRVTPLEEGQGCIAEPKYIWVGIYWLSATLLYTVSLVLAAVWLVNMVNMLFWFIIKPTGPEDPIRTIVTSMAAVLTASMTMRIILAVRGPLTNGGRYAGSKQSAARSNGTVRSRGPTGPGTNPVLSVQQMQPATYTVPLGTESKGAEWAGEDGKSSMNEGEKPAGIYPIEPAVAEDNDAVRIDISTEVHEQFPREK